MKVFITNEVILFRHNILLLDLLCNHIGIILAIIHLLIVVVCTWTHIWFNILLRTQVMVHYKGRLFAIAILSKIMCILLLSKVRIATSKILRRRNRGGIPQAYPTPKKGDCKDCASEERWSNKLKRNQPSQHEPKKSGGLRRCQPQLKQKYVYGHCFC
jgi:hypothetical protein